MDLPSLHDLISFSGKRALVTGAASGIGRATSLRLAEAGAELQLVDIDSERLSEVMNGVSKYGVRAEMFVVDLSRKDEIDRLWNMINGREPDILVNNAGIYVFREFLTIDEEFLDKVMRINLYSMFWMCQKMISSRLDRGGIIINVSSIESILPFAVNLVHYDVSKIGVVALTRALAKEYSKRGFRINAVMPGGIETESVKKIKKDAVLGLDFDVIKTGLEFELRLPIKRFGHPDEVARVILFLASELASYVTGTVIIVDGGFTSS